MYGCDLGARVRLLTLATFADLGAQMQADIGKKVQYFINTGNLVSQTGLDLMQVRLNSAFVVLRA